MRSRLVTHRLAGWVALWALAFAALAPAVSPWLRHDAGPAWFEMCSPEGVKVVSMDRSRDPHPARKPSPDAPSFDHCPYCALQHAVTALPASMFAVASSPPSFERPTRFFSAPRTPFAWRASQPRGPPRAR